MLKYTTIFVFQDLVRRRGSLQDVMILAGSMRVEGILHPQGTMFISVIQKSPHFPSQVLCFCLQVVKMPLTSLKGRARHDKVTSMADNKSIEYIPYDLIIEILSRLPAKELCKLRCACKQWYVLLTCNKYFTAQHMKHSNTEPLLLLRKYSPNFFVEMQKNKVTVELSAIDMEGTVTNKFTTIISGPVDTFLSSNALVILSSMNSLYVLNPTTREVVCMPRSSSAKLLYTTGFGYLPRSNEYKIIRSFFTSSIRDWEMESEILTLRSGEEVDWNSWKSVGICPYKISACDSLCVNGILFWEISQSSNRSRSKEIVSFDLEKEKFEENGYPTCDPTKYKLLGMTGIEGTLSLVGFSKESTMDIWLLKNNTGDTWVMEYIFNLCSLSLGVKTVISSDNHNGDILINTQQKGLMSYSFRNRTFKKVRFSGTVQPYRRPCLYYDGFFSFHRHELHLLP